MKHAEPYVTPAESKLQLMEYDRMGNLESCRLYSGIAWLMSHQEHVMYFLQENMVHMACVFMNRDEIFTVLTEMTAYGGGKHFWEKGALQQGAEG